MRIVFIGAERVGLACLQKLHQLGSDVVGVFTAHEDLRPRIADFFSFDNYMSQINVPYHRVKNSKSLEFVEDIKRLHPDLIMVISWSQIVSSQVIESAPLGCVGIHYSLLPTRRGGAPLNWAVMDGVTKHGISLFYLDEGIDTGDVIAQKEFDIGRDDTIKDLLDKIVVLAPEIISENINLIESGIAPRIKQDESKATYTKPRKPMDSEIDWSLSKEQLHNFIRALGTPYPNAFTVAGTRRLVIPSSKWVDEELWIEGYLE